MLDIQPDTRYQSFWRHFRSGRFQAAQDALASLCRESRGRDRSLYQGLSRAAACLQHLNEGDLDVAEDMARQAGAALADLGPSHGGVQLQSLLLGLSACLEDARRSLAARGGGFDGRPRIPRVDLAFGLDPESTTD